MILVTGGTGFVGMLEEDNVTSESALPYVFGIEPIGSAEGMKTYLN